jgi:hypothetical protein
MVKINFKTVQNKVSYAESNVSNRATADQQLFSVEAETSETVRLPSTGVAKAANQ